MARKLPFGFHNPVDIMVSERINPLPKSIREGLIDVFCPEGLRATAKTEPANRDCIARLYLGKRRSAGRRIGLFGLRNFPLHLDQAEKIGLETHEYAKDMALALAICHWRVKTNAHDVDFVLGSAPTSENVQVEPEDRAIELIRQGHSTLVERSDSVLNFTQRTVNLWMVDFDKVNPLTWTKDGIKEAAISVEENDPYYPKPGTTTESDIALWTTFCDAYLHASRKIMQADHIPDEFEDLPRHFLVMWEEWRLKKTSGRT